MDYVRYLFKQIPLIGSLALTKGETLWFADWDKAIYNLDLADSPDYEKGLRHLRRAIKLGYPDGDRDLGHYYDYHLNDPKTAFGYYRKCAQKGDSICQGWIGLYYIDTHNLPQAYSNLHAYMRFADGDDLDVLYVRPYLVLSVLMVIIHGNSTIDFFDKCQKLEKELLADQDDYHDFFIHRYGSFAELPESVRQAALDFFAKHNITEYRHGTFEMVFYWNDALFSYLLSIFSYGFMPPKKSDGSLFEAVISSEDPLLFLTHDLGA